MGGGLHIHTRTSTLGLCTARTRSWRGYELEVIVGKENLCLQKRNMGRGEGSIPWNGHQGKIAFPLKKKKHQEMPGFRNSEGSAQQVKIDSGEEGAAHFFFNTASSPPNFRPVVLCFPLLYSLYAHTRMGQSRALASIGTLNLVFL